MLLDLFLTFARVGLFTFGGGYAMLSIIEHSCVERKKWITHEDMMNVTVIAESTPGPIAINCSTFVGYRQAGMPGALAATLGMVFPSFVIIYILSMFLEHAMALTLVDKAFFGIRIAVGFLILDAALTMIKKMPKKPQPRAFMLGAFALMLLGRMFALPLSSITLMLFAALISLALYGTKRLSAKKGGDKA